MPAVRSSIRYKNSDILKTINRMEGFINFESRIYIKKKIAREIFIKRISGKWNREVIEKEMNRERNS